MTSPLAVSGTDKPVETPAARPSSLSWSGASCVRPVRKATAAGASEPNGGRRAAALDRAALTRPARRSRTSSRTSPLSPGTWTEHESASRPSTRLMVRRITIVGSRLELNSRVTSERRDSRSRPASASRSASRSCSNTWARSRACAVSPAKVERKRRSGSLGSGCADEGQRKDPERPDAADEGLADDRHRLGRVRAGPGPRSPSRGLRTSSSAATLATTVRPRVKHAPA